MRKSLDLSKFGFGGWSLEMKTEAKGRYVASYIKFKPPRDKAGGHDYRLDGGVIGPRGVRIRFRKIK